MRRRRNSFSRRSNYLMPTLAILVISLLAALGGALYWDKVQKDNEESNSMQIENNEVQEEITLPEPEEDEPVTVEAESEKQEEETPVATSPMVPLCDEVEDSYFDDAVFVGDSLTQGLQLYDILDCEVLANRGINLDTVYNEDKIRVAEGYTGVFAELERIQPAKIYVLLGMNDIAWRDETNFRNLYGKLIDTIQEQHPDAILYIQSIFPVTDWYAKEDNGIDNEKVVTYNQMLMELVEEKGCYYLDVHSALIDENGALPEEASPDGIHLNAPYYKDWFGYLKTHVVP